MTRTASAASTSPAPRVSVLVPCYNLGAYLDEAISSVLDQTFQDFEILIVDDGSTDAATIRRLDGYARPKTTLFRTANQGLAAARNFLVARARGEYLCALDADDVLHPRYLERTVATLDADPSLGFASTKMQMFGQETTIWPNDVSCDLPTLLCHDPVHCAALVRRPAVGDVGGYDTAPELRGNEDWDLWISILEGGRTGIILDEVLFFYRRREGSMSRGCERGGQFLQAVDFLMRKHRTGFLAHEETVASWKRHALGRLTARNDALARRVDLQRDTLASRREERAALAERARRAEDARDRPPSSSDTSRLERELRNQTERAEALEAAYRAATAEVEALRASLSWRLTSPLRAAYDQVAGAPGNRR